MNSTPLHLAVQGLPEIKTANLIASGDSLALIEIVMETDYGQCLAAEPLASISIISTEEMIDEARERGDRRVCYTLVSFPDFPGWTVRMVECHECLSLLLMKE